MKNTSWEERKATKEKKMAGDRVKKTNCEKDEV